MDAVVAFVVSAAAPRASHKGGPLPSLTLQLFDDQGAWPRTTRLISHSQWRFCLHTPTLFFFACLQAKAASFPGTKEIWSRDSL